MSRGEIPVVVVSGAPGTGKSTLGRLVARRLRAALIDQDVATQPLVDVIQRLVGVDDLDDERLARLTRAARYEVIAALAVDNLRAGRPVVLVAPYTAERADAQGWAALASRLVAAGGTPLLVWLWLEPAELGLRLQRRSADRDRAKLAGGPIDRSAPPVVPHLALAADRPADALAAEVQAALR
jgi:predicted kinase